MSLSSHTRPCADSDDDVFPVQVVSHLGEHKAAGVLRTIPATTFSYDLLKILIDDAPGGF